MGISNIGVVAIRVEAIPIRAYFMATSESQTPTKGPKKEPPNMAIKAFLFFRLMNVCLALPLNKVKIQILKQPKGAR